MNVTYSPQRNDNKVAYAVSGEVITATIGPDSDTFDLSVLQPGDRVTDVQTTLPYSPLISAERKADGSLDVVLLYTYAPDEPNEKAPEVL